MASIQRECRFLTLKKMSTASSLPSVDYWNLLYYLADRFISEYTLLYFVFLNHNNFSNVTTQYIYIILKNCHRLLQKYSISYMALILCYISGQKYYMTLYRGEGKVLRMLSEDKHLTQTPLATGISIDSLFQEQSALNSNKVKFILSNLTLTLIHMLLKISRTRKKRSASHIENKRRYC